MKEYDVIVVTIARDENVYLEEWVKYHIDIGVDKIHIYDNMSKIPLQQEIDKLNIHYRSKVEVSLVSIQDFPQGDAYEQAFHTYREIVTWIAYLDIDEFLTIGTDTALSLKQLLKYYEGYRDIGALFLCWKNFNANGHISYEDKSVVERFVEEIPNEIFRDACVGKSIMRAYHALQSGVHYPILRWGHLTKTNLVQTYHAHTAPCYDKLYIRHYYTKSYEEWLWKMKRGTCDYRARKKYSEFFLYNPELKESCWEEEWKNIQMGYAHQEPSAIAVKEQPGWPLEVKWPGDKSEESEGNNGKN